MKRQHIAIGLVANSEGKYLISLRQGEQHLAGKWEFPGGKVEAGESELEALKRELDEEVGLEVKTAELIETKAFDFPDLQLQLSFYRVTEYLGQAEAKEGQPLRWASVDELKALPFPKANDSVIAVL
ncbi:8-oxo-dGTP diphosphatase MutT [Ferrimonas aestuarii]|uniref:8-oxo-dGTP diphosphatase n=1 Tax=Ferrimonas aestuarii TaxID=2569539 RepID=A0A4U1BLB1_9GAMM|nr:8-oxo-dGTP diphosphatase MutT [Ferrimonas aestuarii]TKB53717.1 8-oxo-dGTP diphosphatase MutT [Ferrimonas aestuarii]